VKSEERSRWLLVLGVPLGVLCGMLGLSGTEYRAPILRAFFRYPGERIVPFNLTISLMTLGGAIVGRESSTSAALLRPYVVELCALAAGILMGIYLAARFLGHTRALAVERWTLPALVVIGATLICLVMLPMPLPALPASPAIRAPAGVLLGLLIGAASTVQRISGGELLVPALVLAFGADIKVAGSASACVSFPIVLVGLVRHTPHEGHVKEREYRELVLPMGVGSALGAVTGGYLLSRMSTFALTVMLGGLLIASAVRGYQFRSAD
jgi:uncharacterized membrane protein YfcA